MTTAIIVIILLACLNVYQLWAEGDRTTERIKERFKEREQWGTDYNHLHDKWNEEIDANIALTRERDKLRARLTRCGTARAALEDSLAVVKAEASQEIDKRDDTIEELQGVVTALNKLNKEQAATIQERKALSADIALPFKFTEYHSQALTAISANPGMMLADIGDTEEGKVLSRSTLYRVTLDLFQVGMVIRTVKRPYRWAPLASEYAKDKVWTTFVPAES